VAGDLQAELLRGLLEAQEIPVWLNQEGAGKAYGLTVAGLGNVQILVPSDVEDQARTVLKDYYAGQYEDVELNMDDEGDQG
jgi:hypothetical protein